MNKIEELQQEVERLCKLVQNADSKAEHALEEAKKYEEDWEFGDRAWDEVEGMQDAAREAEIAWRKADAKYLQAKNALENALKEAEGKR